ncbi:toll-like receptor 2 type-2 [Haliotis rufescens]|uniref:toll-like receptor 2 type-2 n=1 Tax=Haliotis rufescens TaxID=6454 RepID=UPI00201EFDEA|nr:toll-like receptor 2 type-2 [Haliotis rufescens]
MKVIQDLEMFLFFWFLVGVWSDNQAGLYNDVIGTPCKGYIYEPCYFDLCNCKAECAKCEGHGRKLTYIPNLGTSITYFFFERNKLVNVTRNTFANVTQVEGLFLSDNNITSLPDDAFTVMPNLWFLDLSWNKINQTSLGKSFGSIRGKKTLRLILEGMDIRDTRRLFEELSGKVTHAILLDQNKIDFLDVSNIRHLMFLSARRNKIQRIKLPNNTYTKMFNLAWNRLHDFPNMCNEEMVSMHRLNRIVLDHNFISSLVGVDFSCLTGLNYISMSANNIDKLEGNTFAELPKLSHIFFQNVLSCNPFTDDMTETSLGQSSVRIFNSAFNNSVLKNINLRGCHLEFVKNVESGAFDGCSNLEVLEVSNNLMYDVTDDYMDRLLGHLTTLKILRMNDCGLFTVPKVVSEMMRNISFLYLSGNRLANVHKSDFENLNWLKHLDVSANKFSIPDPDAFPDKLKTQLESVNFGKNNFDCSCELRWFIKWLKSAPKKFVGYPKEYLCASPPSLVRVPLKDVMKLDTFCPRQLTDMAIIPSVTGATILLMIVVSLAYRWRWHVRYYIYMLRYKKRLQPARERMAYTFDAFVLYCDEDSLWVRNNLMMNLEERHGLKLCLHERDFTPGHYIVDNIIDSLQASRKVVMVLSNSFSQSPWCQFELTLVQKRSLEQDEGYLVVVLLEEIHARNMTSSLYALLQTTTYITWPEQEEDRCMFWDRVKISAGQ